jgi:hypothetical protein
MSRKVTKTQEFKDIRDLFANMEKEFNAVEKELIQGEAEVKLNSISWHFGKMYELYKAIVIKLEIFEPKRRTLLVKDKEKGEGLIPVVPRVNRAP